MCSPKKRFTYPGLKSRFWTYLYYRYLDYFVWSSLMWSKRFFSQNRNENQWNRWNLPERRAVAKCFAKNRFKIWLSNEKAFCWFEYIRSDLGFANFAFRSEIIAKVLFEKRNLSIDSLVSNLVCNIIVRFEIKFNFNSIFAIFLAWKISIKHKISIFKITKSRYRKYSTLPWPILINF